MSSIARLNPFASRLGEGNSGLPSEVNLRRDGMYVAGRGGRMFLARDSSRTIEQHAGQLPLSDAELAAWHGQLEHRTARLHAAGVPYLLVIAPNAHAVYPEDLPDGVATAARRPVHQLLDFLASRDASTNVLYPLDELLAEKAKREVYPRTDTHWNDLGALVAYTRLAEELAGTVPMRTVAEDDFLFARGRIRGDLGFKRRWTRGSPSVAAFARHPAARLVEDNLVLNTGSRLVFECRAAPPGTCLVFADSYVSALLPFLAESFRRLVVAVHPAVDWEVAREEQPSAVVTIMSERFLASRYDDRDGAFAQTARDKVAENQVRARIDRWDGERSIAPVEFELMRAELIRAGALVDAVLLGGIAYAGLWPVELHRLRWADVEPSAIQVHGAHTRRVRLLSPLRADLLEWRELSDANGDDDLVFPSPSGGHWKPGEWREWMGARYRPLVAATGVTDVPPARLRNVFIALLVQEGITLDELFAQIGGKRKHVKAAHGWQVRAVARVGHVPAEAHIERARRHAAWNPGEAQAAPGQGGGAAAGGNA